MKILLLIIRRPCYSEDLACAYPSVGTNLVVAVSFNDLNRAVRTVNILDQSGVMSPVYNADISAPDGIRIKRSSYLIAFEEGIDRASLICVSGSISVKRIIFVSIISHPKYVIDIRIIDTSNYNAGISYVQSFL